MGQFQNFGSSSQRKTDIVATPTKKRALLAVADGAQSTHGVPALGIDPPDLQLASPAPSHCATEAPNMSRALSRNHRHTAIDWEMSACWGGGREHTAPFGSTRHAPSKMGTKNTHTTWTHAQPSSVQISFQPRLSSMDVHTAYPTLAAAHKQTASGEILLWMTPSEAPKALQASECSELLDPMRANCWISAQH